MWQWWSLPWNDLNGHLTMRSFEINHDESKHYVLRKEPTAGDVNDPITREYQAILGDNTMGFHSFKNTWKSSSNHNRNEALDI